MKLNLLKFLFFSALAIAGGAAYAQTLIQGPEGLALSAADVRAEALKIPSADREAFLANSKAVSGLASNLYTRRALAAEAATSGLDKQPEIADALRLARDRVLSDARIRQLDAAAVPDAAAVEAYAKAQYRANPAKYEEPRQIRVAHILIPTSDPDAKSKAEAIRKELMNGADFAALAKEKSADPGSAGKGGDLGIVKPGKMAAPFEAAAFKLTKVGELSPVVETQFGYHVLKLEEIIPARTIPFDEVKAGMVAEARNSLIESARSEKAAALLQQATIDEPAIQAFSAGYRKPDTK